MSPAVSILIPVYNAAPWVGAAIESALAQTAPNVEVVVLDDGSTDGSMKVIRSFAGRVRIEQQPNAGQNVSRNRLSVLSGGDWLVYLDADDELAVDAIERKLELISGADAVYGTMHLQRYRGHDHIATESFTAQQYEDAFAAGFHWKYPNTSSFMFRRSAVVQVGGWNESIRSCTDYDLYFRLLLEGKRFVAAPASVSVYRYWSATQASLEDTFRQTTTRLAVMWHVASELDRASRWTPAAREAFGNATLGVIRSLHLVDASRAAAEFDRLRQWNPNVQPAAPFFSPSYRAAFRLFGYRGAELAADLTRSLLPRRPAASSH